MTKNEFNDLFDLLTYGHDADLIIENQRFFLEWKENGIAVYKMQGDTGIEVTLLQGLDRHEIANMVFDFCFLPEKTLNSNYQDFVILDIE